jgi:transcriptional regulator with XRE-family HTH domain
LKSRLRLRPLTSVERIVRKSLETFGARLKRLRIERGHTQRELAAAIGVTAGAISSIENDLSKTMKPEHVFAAADFFQISARSLVFGTDEAVSSGERREAFVHAVYLALPDEERQAVRTLILALSRSKLA